MKSVAIPDDRPIYYSLQLLKLLEYHSIFLTIIRLVYYLCFQNPELEAIVLSR